MGRKGLHERSTLLLFSFLFSGDAFVGIPDECGSIFEFSLADIPLCFFFCLYLPGWLVYCAQSKGASGMSLSWTP